MNGEVVAVVGGSGFVGTRLCKLLQEQGRDFLIIDKRASETFPDRCVIADVRDASALRAAIPDHAILVNLAAEHRDDVSPRQLYHDVNVTGAENLCSVADEKNISNVVFTSSVACYGNAPPGTDESGEIAPFNEYGRTKYLAERVFLDWQRKDAGRRKLVIVRPTVIFGEQNRGNVYNLLRQIASGRFVMIGAGRNVKSMAYVGNVAAFLAMATAFERDRLIVNYVDEPHFEMNALVSLARRVMGRDPRIRFRLPVAAGLAIGWLADVVAWATGRKLPVSTIRVRKFVTASHFTSAASSLGFVAPHSLEAALEQTIRHEFLSGDSGGVLFYSE